MAEMREMATMKPQLHQESKALKAKSLDINAKMKCL
jgi:hypothetical protein